jgi:hypothetical protein
MRLVSASAVLGSANTGHHGVSDRPFGEGHTDPRATIYRWWRGKETLALDALYTEWGAVQPYPRDTGSLRGDLLALLRPWTRLVRSPPTRGSSLLELTRLCPES